MKTYCSDGPDCQCLVDNTDPAYCPQPVWTEVNLPIRDFLKNLKVGMLLDFGDDLPTVALEGEQPTKYVLVGHVNTESGSCGCCAWTYETNILLRYRTVDLS